MRDLLAQDNDLVDHIVLRFRGRFLGGPGSLRFMRRGSALIAAGSLAKQRTEFPFRVEGRDVSGVRSAGELSIDRLKVGEEPISGTSPQSLQAAQVGAGLSPALDSGSPQVIPPPAMEQALTQRLQPCFDVVWQ